jgi:hypothetical protein
MRAERNFKRVRQPVLIGIRDARVVSGGDLRAVRPAVGVGIVGVRAESYFLVAHQTIIVAVRLYWICLVNFQLVAVGNSVEIGVSRVRICAVSELLDVHQPVLVGIVRGILRIRIQPINFLPIIRHQIAVGVVVFNAAIDVVIVCRPEISDMQHAVARALAVEHPDSQPSGARRENRDVAAFEFPPLPCPAAAAVSVIFSTTTVGAPL